MGIIVGQMVRSSASKAPALKLRPGTVEISPMKAAQISVQSGTNYFLIKFVLYMQVSFYSFPDLVHLIQTIGAIRRRDNAVGSITVMEFVQRTYVVVRSFLQMKMLRVTA